MFLEQKAAGEPQGREWPVWSLCYDEPIVEAIDARLDAWGYVVLPQK